MDNRVSMTDIELVERLRKAASIWFKNEDLLLLEELIRRYRAKGVKTDADAEPPSIE
jgi:hypothetical protein